MTPPTIPMADTPAWGDAMLLSGPSSSSFSLMVRGGDNVKGFDVLIWSRYELLGGPNLA